MKTRILISLLLFVSILALTHMLPYAEARSFSSFKWNIDETYHRDGHVQFVVQKGSENFLPIEVKGLDDVTVKLHPTINHDQTGKAKLPRGVDIHFEPDVVTLKDNEIKTVKLVINVDEDAPASLYDVQIVGTWKEEGKIPDFMGSSIRLHVGHDFGDGKIPVNMLESPLKFWKLIKNEEGGTVNDVPCRNDYTLVVKHDGFPACVKPETVSKLVTREWGMSDNWIKISNVNKAINYQIDNAKITSIQAFSEHKNPSLQEEFKQTWLKINLESKQDGSLKITLPRNLIDSKIGHADDGFFVLLDGTETEYQETETESERILNFSIPAKTGIIGIIGYDYYNPELNQFEIIKKNINQIGYEICDIRLEDDKIIIDLHKFFEDSEPEKKIISKIPPYVEYEIIYHEGYSDYFISTTTSHKCE